MKSYSERLSEHQKILEEIFSGKAILVDSYKGKIIFLTNESLRFFWKRFFFYKRTD